MTIKRAVVWVILHLGSVGSAPPAVGPVDVVPRALGVAHLKEPRGVGDVEGRSRVDRDEVHGLRQKSERLASEHAVQTGGPGLAAVVPGVVTPVEAWPAAAVVPELAILVEAWPAAAVVPKPAVPVEAWP